MGAMIGAIISGAATTVQSLMEGFQQRSVMQAQSSAEMNNSANIRVQAETSSRQSVLAEEFQRRQARKAFGELRAAGAEAGVSASPSFADAYSQAATAAELDALNIRYEGEIRRRGLVAEADAARYRAKIIKKATPSKFMIHHQAGLRGFQAFMGAGGGSSIGAGTSAMMG